MGLVIRSELQAKILLLVGSLVAYEILFHKFNYYSVVIYDSNRQYRIKTIYQQKKETLQIWFKNNQDDSNKLNSSVMDVKETYFCTGKETIADTQQVWSIFIRQKASCRLISIIYLVIAISFYNCELCNF